MIVAIMGLLWQCPSPAPAKKFYCLRQCTSKRGWQSANQSLSPASSQSDRNTQFGFFGGGRCGRKQWGDTSDQVKQWPSGNAAEWGFLDQRFEPRLGEYGRRRPGFESPTKSCAVG